VGDGVAVFESKDCILTQQRVCRDESPGFQMGLLHGVDRHVVAVFILVKHMCVSVREGTALHILTRQADVVPFLDE